MHYKLYTLVDITNTRQYQNSAENRQARSQQQNFDTVIQTIGTLNMSNHQKWSLIHQKSTIWTVQYYQTFGYLNGELSGSFCSWMVKMMWVI